jgi:hypothetical protein
MLDGSGATGEITFEKITFENCTISPDGKYCAWEERVEDPSSAKGYKYVIFVAPSVISGDVQTINKTGKVEIPLPWLIDNLFNYPDQFWWSPSGSSLFIITKIYYDGNPNHRNYRFYIFNVTDSTLDEIPYYEFDGLYRGWTPFDISISPDGKQLLITDHMAYIAILDLSTMEISRGFGCTVSPTCPDHPSPEPSSFPSDFLKNLIIDSVFWLPAANP